MPKQSPQPKSRLDKKLSLMDKETQLQALKRITSARNFGWTRIDFWDDDDTTPPFLSDLVGISPQGTFDFLPLFEDGEE